MYELNKEQKKEEISEELEWEQDSELLTEERTQAKKPNFYCVLMLNDDYTPMDFVVWVIQEVFHKSVEEATQLMLNIHHKGSSRMGLFTYDIARTKIEQVHYFAEKNEYPLQCALELDKNNG